jgi:hypothetical protein
MRGLADELATTRHPLGDEELVAYIMAGLDDDFGPMVSVVVARVESITPPELYSHMLSHELRRVRHSDGPPGPYSSANATMHGRGGFGGRSNGCGRGHGHGNGRGSGSSNSKPSHARSSDGRPRCQVCLRPSHTANICWYRFDKDFEPKQKTTSVVSTSHGTDQNWYLDSGTTDRITGELDKLTTHDRYHGTDQVRTANGIDMPISRIGSSVTLLFILTFVLIMSFMCLMLLSISFLFIVSTWIIIPILNLILVFSLLRIRTRGMCCFAGHVGAVSTPFLRLSHRLYRSTPQSSFGSPLISGIIDWATHHMRLFVVSFVTIICHVLV